MGLSESVRRIGVEPIWERKGLILSGLYSAEELGRTSDALEIIAEVEQRRPDIASSPEFQDAKRSVLALTLDLGRIQE